MVLLAETHPSIGIVNAYTLSGDGTRFRLKFDALPLETTLVSGRKACRCTYWRPPPFLRSTDVGAVSLRPCKRNTALLPNSRPNSDVSVFYRCLQTADLGFIHEVLSFERVHDDALSTEGRRVYTFAGSYLLDVAQYGPLYLTDVELRSRIDTLVHEYYRLLAVGLINFKGCAFWEYHKRVLDELGLRLIGIKLATAVMWKLLDLILNRSSASRSCFDVVSANRASQSCDCHEWPDCY